MQRLPVVIDNGTGFSKVGFAGASEPQYIVPTWISEAQGAAGARSDPTNDLDFFIGQDALVQRPNYLSNPVLRHGLIADFTKFEKLIGRMLYDYLSIDPEDHYVLLTEPPLNTPENRENVAEIMFETYNVPGLYIAVQAVLALCASLLSKASGTSAVTGLVIDSGDGVTHAIPVVDGYVIGSCVRSVPLAGRDVTNFVLQTLRDRGEDIPVDAQLQIAQSIKERFCYVSPDLVKEYNKFDSDATKFRVYEHFDTRTKKTFKIDVGYERFLGPELFFSPEIFSSDWTTPLSDVVDQTVQACPIDCRRGLYKYIALSGGSTLYRHFSQRLVRDIKRKVDTRYDRTKAAHPNLDITKVDVNVVTHPFQRFAVWFGGSMLASQSQFLAFFHTRAQYQEEGPRIARSSPVFQTI